MSDSRVPVTIDEFNAYMVITTPRLIAINPATTNPYWTDFNLTSGENTAWGNHLTAWTPLYASYLNPATSTGIVKTQVQNFMATFSTFAQPLLDRIVASGFANEADEAIFNFVLVASEPTSHEGAIADDCFGTVVGKGRGLFDIHCRSVEDQSRASIPVDSGADSVQYAYAVSDADLDNPDPDTHELMKKEISSKAHFQLDLGVSAQTKWLYIYFRWYNTKHKELAGGWSAMQKIAIG